MNKQIDLPDKFGSKLHEKSMLTLISESEPVVYKKVSYRRYNFLCDCGSKKIYPISPVAKGKIISCGCAKKERMIKLSTTHGLSHHPLYRIWSGMCQRSANCTNPRYARDCVDMSDEWRKKPHIFINWGLENGYKKGLQIDRINNDLGYHPGNCRFITLKENCQNTSLSKYWFIDGVRFESASDASEELGISLYMVYKKCGSIANKDAAYQAEPNCWSELKYPNNSETESNIELGGV